jgi:hypothetical protein
MFMLRQAGTDEMDVPRFDRLSPNGSFGFRFPFALSGEAVEGERRRWRCDRTQHERGTDRRAVVALSTRWAFPCAARE